MGNKLRKVTLSVLLAGSAAVLWAPAAEASREPHPTTTTTMEPSYVPPPKYGQNPHPDLPAEPDPYAGSPVAAPTVVPVDLPAVATDPGAGLAGGGQPLDAAPTAVLGTSDTRPPVKAPSKDSGAIGGILSRTGAETMPLVRAGLAAFALGAGLIVLARRRRTDAAST